MIYLDNAATTKPCEVAVKAAAEAMSSSFGNPSSRHFMGVGAERLVILARHEIALALGCDDGCVFFTSGATESNNTAILGAARKRLKRRPKVVTTTVEHPSVRAAFDRLESEGALVTRISPDENGEITEKAITDAVDGDTCLVSCMLVNNETGYILPISRAFAAIKRRYPDCVTHTDAVQGFLKLPFKASQLNADLISVSGHKVYAPKGIGALYVAKGTSVQPFMLGGGQEGGFRSGTENVPAIAGFGAAAAELRATTAHRYSKACALREMLYNSIDGIGGVTVNSKPQALPYICSIAMKGYKSETLLNFLSAREICVSSGSACSKGRKSAVLGQFGIPDALADSTLRVSFSSETTQSDVLGFVQALNDAKRLATAKPV